MTGILREGGPHNVRQVGTNQHELSVSVPTKADGYLGRECPDKQCAPAYFQVKPGTGLSGQPVAYCAYCRTEDSPQAFATTEQVRYAKDHAVQEARKGVDDLLRESLGLDAAGRKRYGGGFLSIEISLKTSPAPPIAAPFEEELRRDVRCPGCTLDHAVFGLATWCPDCGADIFPVHLHAEASIIRRILTAVPDRHATLGARVAARDVENALEDAVSIFEAGLKSTTRRWLTTQGKSPQEIEAILATKIRNGFQNPDRAADLYKEVIGRDLFVGVTSVERTELVNTFAKRHPITHNLGVIDRQYLARARTGQLEGREIRVSPTEVDRALTLAHKVVTTAYQTLFPNALTPLV
jgi:hypothetical protein